MMSRLEAAAKRLRATLAEERRVLTIGVRERSERIVVYVKEPGAPVPLRWQGFPVDTIVMRLDAVRGEP